MDTEQLTSAEVVTALVEARAVGSLTVSGHDGLVVVTGPEADRARAKNVLCAKGWRFITHPSGWDEWSL